jgi:hypothetical protein
VSKPLHKCPACSRRVKRAPYIALTDRRTRRETRFHGAPRLACLQAGAAEAERRGKDAIILHFAHPKSCGDAGSGLECRSQCFMLPETEEAHALGPSQRTLPCRVCDGFHGVSNLP